MALDFPTATSVGQLHVQNGYRFSWDGSKWQSLLSDPIQVVDGGNFTSGFSLAVATSDINGGSFD